MKKRSLGFKMVFGGILIVLIPILVIGIFSLSKSSNALSKLSMDAAVLTAHNLAEMAELVLEEEAKFVKEMASRASLKTAAAKVQAAGADAAGDEITAVNRDLALSLKELGKDYETLIVVDVNGKVFADPDNGKQKGIDIAVRPYFQKAKSTGQATVSDPVVSKISGKLVAPICAPIKDDTGRFIGAVVNVLRIEFLTDKITAVKIGETGYPFVVNAEGLVIVHPNKEHILKLDISKIPEMAAIHKAMGSIKKGVEQYTFKGVDKIAGFAPIELAGWSLVATQDEAEFLAPTVSIRNAILLASGIFLAVTVLCMLLFSRSITKPINRVAEHLNSGSDEVASAASQVSAASQTLAEGASEQAASIQETSASLEEISAMTKQNAEHARQANILVTEANRIIDTANQSMRQLTDAMKEISKSSEETQKIVKTIDEIAFQTNLLALNAAVEAARAGEAGAGFAVVADEVRNLAIRAAEAAKNTSGLIDGSVKRIKDGTDLVDSTNSAFTEVATSSKKIADLVGEINAASSEQAQGIDQINKAVSEMDKVVGQNAANAEESASASEELNAQAEQMKSAVGELVGIISGNARNSEKENSDNKSPVLRQMHRAGKLKKNPERLHAPNVAQQLLPLNGDEFKDF